MKTLKGITQVIVVILIVLASFIFGEAIAVIAAISVIVASIFKL